MDTNAESQRIKVQGYSAQGGEVGRDREGARSLHESLEGDDDGHPRTWEREQLRGRLLAPADLSLLSIKMFKFK